MGERWKLKLLYDGLCPICAREIDFMRRRDRAGALAFEDLADPRFDPSRYGLTLPQVVRKMHGVLPDGRLVTGLDAFRAAYRALGMGWLVAWTEWPILRTLAELGYRVFARVRPRFSKYRCDSDRCAPVRD